MIKIWQLFGVFDGKNEIQSVEFTYDEAYQCIGNMNSKTNHDGSVSLQWPKSWKIAMVDLSVSAEPVKK